MQKIKRSLGLNINYFLRGRTPHLVYSMERTGSVALFNSLCAQGCFAIATHYMDPAKLATEPQSGSAKWAYKHLVHKQQPVKIISLVRNPIENFLSIFARSEFPKNDANQSGCESSADELSHQFKTQYLDKNRHFRQLDWFETEFKVSLGIDIYQHSFDKDAGYLELQEGPFQVLVMRTELDNDRKSHLVSRFLDLPGFEMGKANAKLKATKDSAPGMPGEQTKYAQAYKVLKQGATLADEYLDEIIGSRYVQHFFTQDELVAARKRFGKS